MDRGLNGSLGVGWGFGGAHGGFVGLGVVVGWRGILAGEGVAVCFCKNIDLAGGTRPARPNWGGRLVPSLPGRAGG